jgi:hypothetical protein
MEFRKVEYKECREQRGDCWVCPLQPVNSDRIGLNPTIVPLIGPLIGRAHANLGWSPQTHDTIYRTKGSQERLTLVPRPKTLATRGPPSPKCRSVRKRYNPQQLGFDVCCFSAGQQYEDSNYNSPTTIKVCFPIPLSRTDLLVIKILPPVADWFSPVVDWFSRDLGIDTRQYRF